MTYRSMYSDHGNKDKLIRDIHRFGKTPLGEIGIEVEVEGTNLPQINSSWRKVHDGSLRGESAEYVLKTPAKREAVPKLLAALETALTADGVGVIDSNRTGVHIHLNFLRNTQEEVFKFITLYAIYEDLLVQFCGDDRVGNHFCLRMRDARELLKDLSRAAEVGDLFQIATDDNRYAALNIKALRTYGSLESRSMRGTVSADLLQTWINLLLRVKDASLTFATPFEIMTQFSSDGVRAFTERVFGDMMDLLTTDRDWENTVHEGMWQAQDIAGPYDHAVETYKPSDSKTKKNPYEELQQWTNTGTGTFTVPQGTYMRFDTAGPAAPSPPRPRPTSWMDEDGNIHQHHPVVTATDEEVLEEEFDEDEVEGFITAEEAPQEVAPPQQRWTGPTLTSHLRGRSTAMSNGTATTGHQRGDTITARLSDAFRLTSPTGVRRQHVKREFNLRTIPARIWYRFVIWELMHMGIAVTDEYNPVLTTAIERDLLSVEML